MLGLEPQVAATALDGALVRERRTATVVVEGEGHAAQLGEPRRPALLVVVEPAAFVRDQHRWPRVVPLRQSQTTDHRGTVGGVFKVFDLDHAPGSTTGAIPHRGHARAISRPDRHVGDTG